MRMVEGRLSFFFPFFPQCNSKNDDETIRRVGVEGLAGRGEMGRWCGWGGGEGFGELHSSVNDFLAVQRDVKDRLT